VCELGHKRPRGLRHSLPVKMTNTPTYDTVSGGLGCLAKKVPLMLAVFWFAFAALLCAPAVAAPPETEGIVRASPHDFGNKSNCAVCHQDEPPALTLDPMATCTKCHHNNMSNHPVSRHPLGIKPRISVPAFLPLTQDGKMVCYTCHDPHNKSGIDNMLRVNFIRLCASCHAGY